MISFIESLSDFYHFDFLGMALISTILLSLSCGILSPLVISRKSAFMGAAVSHSSLLSLSLGMMLVGLSSPHQLFFITLFITLILVAFLAHGSFRQKLPTDAIIGIFFSATMGAGILIHSIFLKGQGSLISYLFGSVMLVTSTDIIYSAIVSIVTSLSIFIPFKNWIYSTFDEEGARVSGISTKAYHYLFFFLLTFIIISSLKVAGTVLVNTLLLVPGYFGLKYGKNIKQTFTYSIAFSVAISVLALTIANFFSLPSGATLAVTQFSVLVIFSLLTNATRLIR